MGEIMNIKEARKLSPHTCVSEDTCNHELLAEAKGYLEAFESREIKNMVRLLESFSEEWNESDGNETPIQIIRRIERNSREVLEEYRKAMNP
jgi:hypothetical protein